VGEEAGGELAGESLPSDELKKKEGEAEGKREREREFLEKKRGAPSFFFCNSISIDQKEQGIKEKVTLAESKNKWGLK
jgi:hypothetical protein